MSVGQDVKAVHIPEQQRPSMDTASIIGLIIWFVCVLYSSIRSSSNAQAARYTDKIDVLFFQLIWLSFELLDILYVKISQKQIHVPNA